MVRKYKVKPGDTVNKIIEKNSVLDNDFEKYNNLNNLRFIKDQMVLVPESLNTSIKLSPYKTKENDTINKISKKYKVSSSEIRYFNRIDCLYLTSNQVVILGDD